MCLFDCMHIVFYLFFFQVEEGVRVWAESRGRGEVYMLEVWVWGGVWTKNKESLKRQTESHDGTDLMGLSLIHI